MPAPPDLAQLLRQSVAQAVLPAWSGFGLSLCGFGVSAKSVSCSELRYAADARRFDLKRAIELCHADLEGNRGRQLDDLVFAELSANALKNILRDITLRRDRF